MNRFNLDGRMDMMKQENVGDISIPLPFPCHSVCSVVIIPLSDFGTAPKISS